MDEETLEFKWLFSTRDNAYSEIRERRSDLYRLHTLLFVLVAATLTFFGLDVVDTSLKMIALALLPFAYAVLILLFFQAKKRVAMMEAYVQFKLNPQIAGVIDEYAHAGKFASFEEVESFLTGRTRGIDANKKLRRLMRRALFGSFALCDFALSFVCAVVQLVIYNILELKGTLEATVAKEQGADVSGLLLNIAKGGFWVNGVALSILFIMILYCGRAGRTFFEFRFNDQGELVSRRSGDSMG